MYHYKIMDLLVAHRLRKEQYGSNVEIDHGTEVLSSEHETADRLTDQLRKTFRRQSPILGTFRKADGTVGQIAQLLVQYLEGAGNSEMFLRFSTSCLDVLVSEMKKSSLSTGGIVVFAQFLHEEIPFILIALVTEKEVPWFDEAMRLRENQSIDLDRLRHGVRINLDNHFDADASGVAVLRGRKKEADYFSAFVDFEAKENLTEIAAELHDAMDGFFTDQGIGVADSTEVYQRVHEYISEQRTSGGSVTLIGIANAAYPNDPDPLIDHLTRDGSTLPGEFTPLPNNEIKYMTEFAETHDNLTIRYNREIWATRISAAEDSNGRFIIIREPPEETWEKLHGGG